MNVECSGGELSFFNTTFSCRSDNDMPSYDINGFLSREISFLLCRFTISSPYSQSFVLVLIFFGFSFKHFIDLSYPAVLFCRPMYIPQHIA